MRRCLRAGRAASVAPRLGMPAAAWFFGARLVELRGTPGATARWHPFVGAPAEVLHLRSSHGAGTSSTAGCTDALGVQRGVAPPTRRTPLRSRVVACSTARVVVGSTAHQTRLTARGARRRRLLRARGQLKRGGPAQRAPPPRLRTPAAASRAHGARAPRAAGSRGAGRRRRPSQPPLHRAPRNRGARAAPRPPPPPGGPGRAGARTTCDRLALASPPARPCPTARARICTGGGRRGRPRGHL